MSKQKANTRISQEAVSASKGSKLTAVIISVVLTAAVAGICGAVIYHNLKKKNNSDNYNVVVTPDNVEEIIAQVQDKEYTPVGYYEVSMNTDWVFADANSASDNAYVKNTETNSNTVYFTIALKDNPDSDIYTSPLIPGGSYMQNISLNGAIEKTGLYDAILTYHLMDESNVELSKVSVSITITINK